MQRTLCNPNLAPGNSIPFEEVDVERVRDVVLHRYCDELVSYALADPEMLEDLLRELLSQASCGADYRMTDEAKQILDDLLVRGVNFVAGEHPVEFSRFVV